MTSPSPRLLVVLLHGWNMRPSDLEPFTRSLGVDADYLVPAGPHAVPDGALAWWPVDEAAREAALSRGPRDLHDAHPVGREAARQALAQCLQVALAERPGARLVLAGFSQGGMLATDLLLHEEVPVAALALFSSSCIALDEWQPRLRQRPALRGLPVLVTHGRDDEDLAFTAGERLRDTWVAAGAEVHWLPFDGGHIIPMPAWRALRTLLRRIQGEPS